MKRMLFLVLIAAAIVSCNPTAKNEFTISGSVDTVFDSWVYLQKRLEGPFTSVDSVKLSNGSFTFTGTIDYPELYYIRISETKSRVSCFLEPGKINIEVDIEDSKKTKITGSQSHEEYKIYMDSLEVYYAMLRENYSLYTEAEEDGDTELAAYYDSLITDTDNQRFDFVKGFVFGNKNSPVVPYLLYRNLYNYEIKELDSAVTVLDTSLNASPYMPLVSDHLKTLRRTDIGMEYVSFSMQDTSGAFLTIDELIGENYLLIDFWASWCRPCREENPNLVAVYNDYKDRGFDIFGVSLDRNKDSWLKAIYDDELTWAHVSDLAYWNNAAAKLYGIRSIPSNVLLDPSGTIIAKNLRGDALREKLKQIFAGQVV
jgi:peroxiredoxin